jgi:hypothetical protein
MNIRSNAIEALGRGLAQRDLREAVGFGPDAVGIPAVNARILTSKVYPPEKSWTSRWSWWHQVPAKKLIGDSTLLLVCEARARGFHLLVVPQVWLRDHRDQLYTEEATDRITLYLSAEEPDLFQDMRGGRLNFSVWRVGDVE